MQERRGSPPRDGAASGEKSEQANMDVARIWGNSLVMPRMGVVGVRKRIAYGVERDRARSSKAMSK